MRKRTKQQWKGKRRNTMSEAQQFAKWMEKFGSVSHRIKSERMFPDEWKGAGEVVAFRLTQDRPGTFWALFQDGVVAELWPARDVLEPLRGMEREAFERRVWRTRVLRRSHRDARPENARYLDLVRMDED